MKNIKCMKCGKRLEENKSYCTYCKYTNNLESGYIDESTIISKPGEKRVLDYKKIAKKTFIVVITTAMIGLASAGTVFILSADKEMKISMGLMSTSGIALKKEVKELLRGVKFGMSREDITGLESKYSDSVKELNNEDYITYTGCKYGGYEGRTTYRFTANNLSEISVVFYPQEDTKATYDSLISTFTKEYGEPVKTEDETEAATVTNWNNGKLSVKLQLGEYINLIIIPENKEKN